MTEFIKPKKVKRSTEKIEEKMQEKIDEKDWSKWGIDSSSEVNKKRFKNIFDPNTMFEAREVLFPKGVKGVVCYFDDLVISAEVNEHVIEPLVEHGPEAMFKDLGERVITSKKIRQFEKLKDAVDFLTSGGTIVHVDGMNYFIGVVAPGFPARSVTEPQAEPLVRGPREGFTEKLQDNSALVRKRLRTPDLKSEEMKIGRRSKTTVLIMYVDGLVADDVLKTVKDRMEKIDIDVLIESAQLEELIEDDMFSPFPQIVHTERPDKVVAGLAEGRVALLIDGTPFALIVPSVFYDFMQASEDYYERFYFSSAIRILRMITFLIALLVPSIYVAVTTFHQELIPSPLLYTIIAARAGVPFPVVIEAFLMEISFEILREAGVRLPRPVGSAVSIVGALVVGQAAVDAGIESQP
ncbi:MAG TPA: spore germination protein, partial [Paenibacillaceae bacterium]|nr:spore germination protein [Paenibacillaceae bacterium]